MTEPVWLEIARKDIGLREVKGTQTAPKIAGWLQSLGAWWREDETPWCGVAVAAWMQQAGVSLPKHWYRAKGWLDWGVTLPHPVVGCVVVYEREGGGHVGLVTGRNDSGHIVTLGGNQGDSVSERPFDPARVAGYRWPAGLVVIDKAPPLLAATGPVSRNEA